ncbi:zeta toxin%3B poison-antidote element [Escherichia coli]|nr:zeta toxin%3B poison-antidote element [Escherichia coli]CTZ13944.1 zeta toxin%3B poison-antidote element [Escherichia coli]CTZ42542.1 zeta toxin%3B poison-antidote element [Escherichia coli]
MATLMEKDALLNGASQCIAFLSNIIDNCSVSSHQDSGDALKRLVSYRDYLYSTPAELVDFTQGKILLQWICPYISRHLLSLNPLLACCRRYSRGER